MKRWTSIAILSLGLTTLALTPACMCEKEKGEKAEHHNEVNLTLAECPTAVQNTINKEAAGGAVKEVEKETKKDKTFYSADITVGGKACEIKVAEDGTLLKKKLDDDGDKKEKEEKGEHEDKD